MYNSDVRCALWRVKSIATQVFVQQLMQTDIKTPKPRITDLLWGQFTGDSFTYDSNAKIVSMSWRHHILASNTLFLNWSMYNAFLPEGLPDSPISIILKPRKEEASGHSTYLWRLQGTVKSCYHLVTYSWNAPDPIMLTTNQGFLQNSSPQVRYK